MFNTEVATSKKKKKKNHTKMKTDSPRNLTYKTESEICGYKESRSVLRLLVFLKILCLPEKQLPCKQKNK